MTKRRESREQAFTLLFEKTVTGDSMEDIIEMAKEARDVVIDPYCEKLTALTELYLDEIDHTIEENLRWGNAEATQEEIEQACRAAQAHDFIMSFPDGYDTDLGQGGVNVSGGQKQRLCIARALLKKPKIVILDDSTSAVDTATDARIRQAFREELAGTTTIIIAQRVASVMDADRIMILNDGRIADIGTHEELMRRSEIYREVYTSQQKGSAA